MKRQSRLHMTALVALGVIFATGCHRMTSSATPESAALGSAALAKGASASGNGEGYLGMIARNYQVIPGHECNDGTTSKLGYAASLFKDSAGQIRLTGDACSNQSVAISATEIVPVNAEGTIVSVRGGLFEYRPEAPVPTVQDNYRQLSCSWKANEVEYSAVITSDMAGTKQLLELHKKWFEPGATVRSAARIQKWIRVTNEFVGDHEIFRGETTDVLIDANLAVRGYKGKVLTTLHYSGTETLDAEIYCFVNNRDLK